MPDDATFPQGLMNLRDPDLLMNVGAGLMSGARYGSNAGEGILQGLQSYRQQKLAQQQMQMGAMQLRMLQSRMPAMDAFYKNAPAMLGMGGQGAQPPQGSPPGMPTGGPPGAPQGAPQGPSPDALQGQQDPYALMRMGALGGLAGVPGAEQFSELGKAQLQYNPALKGQMEAAGNKVEQLRILRNQAIQRGDMGLAGQLDQQMRQEAGATGINERTGAYYRRGPNGEIAFTLPEQGTQTSIGADGRVSQAPIPGAAGAQGAVEGGRAVGKAQGETVEVTMPDGSHATVPKSAVLRNQQRNSPAAAPQSGAQPPAATASPPGTQPAQPFRGPSITGQAMLKGNAAQAVETNKDFQAQAEAGQQMLTNTQELRNAAHDFTPNGLAGTRTKILSALNSWGLLSADQQKSLGSAQAGQKIAIQLQAAATKQLGSREAAQIFAIMGKSLPNLELSQDGLDKVSGYMDGIARYNMFRAQTAQQRAATNDANGVNSVRNEFIQNTNPLYFIAASSPPNIQKEIVTSMGDKAPKFLEQWKAAAKSGWAPRPMQYWGQQ